MRRTATLASCTCWIVAATFSIEVLSAIAPSPSVSILAIAPVSAADTWSALLRNVTSVASAEARAAVMAAEQSGVGFRHPPGGVHGALRALRLGFAERADVADQSGHIGDFDAEPAGAVADIRQRRGPFPIPPSMQFAECGRPYQRSSLFDRATMAEYG